MENALDETHARRVAKRCGGLCTVKRTPAYILVMMNKAKRAASPDPFDERISKRKWEKSLMDFRKSLRDTLRQINTRKAAEGKGTQGKQGKNKIEKKD